MCKVKKLVKKTISRGTSTTTKKKTKKTPAVKATENFENRHQIFLKNIIKEQQNIYFNESRNVKKT